ncbi:MAG: methyltransferase domain-containing protein [Kofleriaceae bacterium]
MTSSPSAFTGSIPELYDRYLGPALFEPYAAELASRLPLGTARVLEVAAGTGRVTRHLVAALPVDGVVVATDLNQAMLDHAARVLADARVTWQAADAAALPTRDACFDAVVCQFGLMFFPDKAAALGEMRRALRPGGRLLISTWDRLAHNQATAAMHDLAQAMFADDPPLFMLTPFAMHDPAALAALAEAAGFVDVAVDTVAHTAHSPSAAALAIGFVRGNPLWHQLTERGVDADRFERAVAARLAARFGAAPCRSPLSAHVVTATAP